jgi:hypothetical protein
MILKMNASEFCCESNKSAIIYGARTGQSNPHSLSDQAKSALPLRSSPQRRFRPWMTHSVLDDAATMLFHSQMLHDYVTVDAYCWMLIEEFGR